MVLHNVLRTLRGHGKHREAREFQRLLQAVKDLQPAPSVSEDTRQAVVQILRNSGEFSTCDPELDFRTVALR